MYAAGRANWDLGSLVEKICLENGLRNATATESQFLLELHV